MIMSKLSNSCEPSWRFDFVVSTSVASAEQLFVQLSICEIYGNLGCFSWTVLESQICLPIFNIKLKNRQMKSPEVNPLDNEVEVG